MDADRFDALLSTLVATLAAAPSRRAALRLLAGLGLSGLAGQTEAKKKKRKKKCAQVGQRTSKKKKRKKCCPGLVKDAAGLCASPPNGCTPVTCPPALCGSVPDGCGGTLRCGCAANELCLSSGVCQPCTVTCTGSPTACGADLQKAMDGGGTIYVCPGLYRGGFELGAAVRVLGAGEGADAASNTVLDANDAGSVLRVKSGVGTVELERLRLTDGNASEGAGIFLALNSTLRMTECTVSGNTAIGAAGLGGGIATLGTLQMTRCTIRDNHAVGTGSQVTAGNGGGLYVLGPTTLTDCLVADNHATDEGGGLWVGSGSTMPSATLTGSTQVRDNAARFGAGIFAGGTLTVAETCRVVENTASAPGNGGGIYYFQGQITLQGTGPSPIVVNNCHENCIGNVPKCAAAPVSCPP